MADPAALDEPSGVISVWLYTRGSESVRLVLVRRGTGFELMSDGPGRKRATYFSEDRQLLISFQSARERALLSNGFEINASVGERRVRRRQPGGSWSAPVKPSLTPIRRA